MKKMLFVAIAMMFVFGVQAQQKAGIEVKGYAERKVVPNEIYMSITINESDEATAKSRKSLEELERLMYKKLKDIGIDKLEVLNVSSDFHDAFMRKSEARTSKSYQVKVSTANEVSQVTAEMENIGISNVRVIKATRSDIEKIKEELSVEAILNAKKRAEALTYALGQPLYGAIYIDDTRYSVVDTYVNRNVMYAAAKGESSIDNMSQPDIPYKELTFSHSVEVVFSLVPTTMKELNGALKSND